MFVRLHKDLLSHERRELVEHYLDHYGSEVGPTLGGLRKSIIHSDGNDYNVLVLLDDDWTPTVSGIIDFGDMVYSHTVNEVAIAAAYAMMDKADPLAVAAQVTAGYHAEYPLTEDELAVLFGLICMRLCTSACMAAVQQAQAPENEYLSISLQPAWLLLERLRDVHPRYVEYVLRHACGLPACPRTPSLLDWLAWQREKMAPIMDADLETSLILDLSVGSELFSGADLAGDVSILSECIQSAMNAADAEVAIGRYDEARLIYRSDQFFCESDELPERRTVHLGVDLFVDPGAPVDAPLAGVVQSAQNNADVLDYGPTVILRHESDAGPIFTLYGHLSVDALSRCQPGQAIDAGEQIGSIGATAVNGGWPPHLHFQVITDLLGEVGNFPGVANPSYREVWTSICPNPSVILGMGTQVSAKRAGGTQDILERRSRNLGKSLSISYGNPLHIVRGWKQFLYDVDGRAYLDGVNNVCHVGHCHPHVVQAGQRQMAVLNTNTRYLHDNIVDYAERLLAKFPAPLGVVFFVCSGSEANELALRLARTYTGRQDILMLDAAYHGNTQALVDISPYKHDGCGGSGAPAWAHKITMPDPYRGLYSGYGAETGAAYAGHVKQTIADLQAQGREPAAFIAESVLGCGGQIVLPERYLAEAYRHVHAAGGVCITDEVQVGFGRVGSHFWGFETQGVVPDIVTMGKPIGNGHPLAAVVTTPAIADAFANGMEYFNTFGGNPVSCAIGMAVLDVIEDEGLQENALRTGNRLLEGLRQLSQRYPLVGDARGLGLFVGAELVLDRDTCTPAPRHASYIADRLRDHGILVSTDGPDHNVLKLKPPMVFDADDADQLVSTLEKVLQEDCLRVG